MSWRSVVRVLKREEANLFSDGGKAGDRAGYNPRVVSGRHGGCEWKTMRCCKNDVLQHGCNLRCKIFCSFLLISPSRMDPLRCPILEIKIMIWKQCPYAFVF